MIIFIAINVLRRSSKHEKWTISLKVFELFSFLLKQLANIYYIFVRAQNSFSCPVRCFLFHFHFSPESQLSLDLQNDEMKKYGVFVYNKLRTYLVHHLYRMA